VPAEPFTINECPPGFRKNWRMSAGIPGLCANGCTLVAPNGQDT